MISIIAETALMDRNARMRAPTREELEYRRYLARELGTTTIESPRTRSLSLRGRPMPRRAEMEPSPSGTVAAVLATIVIGLQSLIGRRA